MVVYFSSYQLSKARPIKVVISTKSVYVINFYAITFITMSCALALAFLRVVKVTNKSAGIWPINLVTIDKQIFI